MKPSIALMSAVKSTASAPVRQAASLLLIAPTSKQDQIPGDVDYKILTIQRGRRGFFGGLTAFPGGALEKSDSDITWPSVLEKVGVGKDQLDKKTSTVPLSFYIAAIRETFEEVGALLAYPSKHFEQAEWDQWRTRIHDDASQFLEMCKELKISPAVKHLVHWSNWITPKVEPKRFDTQFFMTVLPRSEADMVHTKSASADGSETTSMQWLTPKQVLTAFKERKLRMFPPQYYLLTELDQQCRSINDLKDYMDGKKSRSNFDLVSNCPEFTKSENGKPIICYPGDPLHSTTDKNIVDKLHDRHRLNLTMGDKESNSVGQIVDMEFIRQLSPAHLASFKAPVPRFDTSKL